ncbi:hypothetical protein L202_05876 [Cryptococcus amylolentus CBS 6039]|uniref:Extracellular membrane protein CFEM domain-containing protein n=2 Tax=Cryptococcus amylolentus TaxID=104669 RepID=A0A1E3HHQ6_9TREE|nr:hypothetical protein L202_05876 [Cryptococcus amylolentus CBS 6039]ODN75887.1 hypothetical protein L202_05876 [Cryptococcus amylolentus CBS 6039]ODN97033.1 hypothetical protein I350_08012 [Cryptococcus amylolentus CBS 6273]
MRIALAVLAVCVVSVSASDTIARHAALLHRQISYDDIPLACEEICDSPAFSADACSRGFYPSCNAFCSEFGAVLECADCVWKYRDGPTKAELNIIEDGVKEIRESCSGSGYNLDGTLSIEVDTPASTLPANYTLTHTTATMQTAPPATTTINLDTWTSGSTRINVGTGIGAGAIAMVGMMMGSVLAFF